VDDDVVSTASSGSCDSDLASVVFDTLAEVTAAAAEQQAAALRTQHKHVSAPSYVNSLCAQLQQQSGTAPLSADAVRVALKQCLADCRAGAVAADELQCSLVRYALKQLVKVTKQHRDSGSSADVLQEWLACLDAKAQQAAEKLRKVRMNCSLHTVVFFGAILYYAFCSAMQCKMPLIAGLKVHCMICAILIFPAVNVYPTLFCKQHDAKVAAAAADKERQQQVQTSSTQAEPGSNTAHSSPSVTPLISTDDDILHEQLQELSPFARAWVPPAAAAAVAASAVATATATATTAAEREAAAVQTLLAAALKSASDVSQLSADVAYTPYPAPGSIDCPAVLRLYMHASSFAHQVALWQHQQQQQKLQQRDALTVRSTQDKLKQSAELSRQQGDAPVAAAMVYLQLQLQRCALRQVLHSGVPQVLNDWQALDLWHAAVAANGRTAAALLSQVWYTYMFRSARSMQ
jgi:hypothetical protein